MRLGRKVLSGAILASLSALTAGPGEAADEIDRKVDELLARMTLEEKVGQMTQLSIQTISRRPQTPDQEHELDPAKLEEVILQYHVGSILNVWEGAFSLDHWHQVITAIQDVAIKKSRLGIPILYGIDSVHGANYVREATIFPHNLAMAATRNVELMQRVAEIAALETRAAGIPWNFAPVLDLGRQPLWPRFYETFGEDPYLASVMGAAAVRGFQAARYGSRPWVAACAKHYLGYSFPLSGKDRTPAWIPFRMLLEYFVPPFKAAIREGVMTVMVNSGEINGEPVHASRFYLTELLRRRLGFRGVVVSDWEDIIRLHTRHRVAESEKEATRLAILAGIDMSMVPLTLNFPRYVVELVREGKIPESRIDESVRRILRLKFELGLFDQPYPDPALKARVGSTEFQELSRQAAEEAITLLKNDGLLPLSKDRKVLVTGPGASSLSAMHGGWTYTWQGRDERYYPKGVKTLLEAIRDKIGAANVVHVPGADFERELDIEAAVKAAATVDVAIVCLAEQAVAEKPGDIDDLTLPAAQLRLAEAIEGTGKPVVLVLYENRPRVIRTVVDQARAIVLAYEPGPYGGVAVADVLFGDVNPSGRLPFTYPRAVNALVHYDHKFTESLSARERPGEGYQPEWDFGHGLSYTRFEYRNLRVEPREVDAAGMLTISVEVANTGSRPGKHAVELYVRDLYASITPPNRRLRAFQKISLAPGQAQTVVFHLPVRELAFIGLNNEPVVEPGEFEAMVGNQTVRFRVK